MNSGPGARRSDAARNRTLILDTARAAFADTGTLVSMAEIARRSGVGSATLYRNFASRRQLLEALYDDEVDAVSAAARTVAGDTPGGRLANWLRRFFDYFMSKRGVARELLRHVEATDPVFGTGRARVTAAGQPLLEAAIDSGEIADDLTLDQILDLVVAVADISDDRAYVVPILDRVLAGLRRVGSH